MYIMFKFNINIQINKIFATRIFKKNKEDVMDKLKAIKITVFILTFLLIFGTLCILGLLLNKNRPNSSNIPEEISLEQPQGSYIKEIQVNNEKLYILTVGGGIEDRIVIYDISDNKIITTVRTN